MTGGVALCLDVSPSLDCSCPAPKTIACDPYDKNFKLICDGDGNFLGSTTCAPKSCSGGVCMDAGDITTTQLPETELCTNFADLKVPITPDCTTFTYCSDETTTLFPPSLCSNARYFNFDSQNCEALPPKPCVGCDGSCADPFNCKIFHSCLEGVSLGNTTCISEEVYDVKEGICKVEGICSPMTQCKIGENTEATTVTTAPTTASSAPTTATTSLTTATVTPTTKPPTCTTANVGKNYPYPGDCRK